MQPGSLALETLGFIAAILTTLSFLPQALRIRRRRSADDVSFTMYLMMVTGQSLWLVYGIVIASPSMIGANVVAMSFVTWVLIMKLRHLRRMRDQAALPAGTGGVEARASPAICVREVPTMSAAGT